MNNLILYAILIFIIYHFFFILGAGKTKEGYSDEENKLIEDITDYDPAVISIWSRRVLTMIQDGSAGWENFVPESVAKTVKAKCLFGAKCDV